MSLTPLLALRSPAILFQGQGSPWQLALSAAAAHGGAGTRLREVLNQARQLTAPFTREIASTIPGVIERLSELISPEASPEEKPADVHPAILHAGHRARPNRSD